MKLSLLAQTQPDRLVTLHFDGVNGKGALTLSAQEAIKYNSNQSGRYFPPQGQTAAGLGWSAPWWYAQECIGFTLA